MSTLVEDLDRTGRSWYSPNRAPVRAPRMSQTQRLWTSARVRGRTSTRWTRRWWRSRTLAVPILLAMAWALAMRRGGDVDLVAPSPEAAIAEVLSARDLACEAGDVTWIGVAGGMAAAGERRAQALVRARATGDPSDLYLVEARVSPEGAVLDVGTTYNLTGTSGVDESRPLVRGRVAVYTAAADGLVTGIHVLDLAGWPRESYADFTRVQRVQVALTNLQQTGQFGGVVHTTFALNQPVAHVTLAWRPDATVDARLDDRVLSLDPTRARAMAGAELVRVVADEHARPGNVITWAVDRARAMPWLGDDKMQWVKAIAFTVLDKAHATFSRGTSAEDVRDELGLPSATEVTPVTFSDPEIGWPPPPIKPVVSPPLPGEGRWIHLDRDPFITPTASGGTPAFVTSFIRPDAHRPDERVYVTFWDPRQIALHMEAGTVEPISATGEHGPGMIPRTPEVMRHVVAAFNGGFQAQHGEYGMQANGIEYLPPKPYAATVVELRDGSNAFGAWPASAGVPEDVVAVRQNLTALVQDGRFNPWGRNWWGGAPPGWPDQIHTARSAICLTREGFAGYFYSASISAEDLAQGMLAARCSFGIHLDMNVGHAGFEFYDVARQGEIGPLGRSLQADWEAEGKVPDMSGYVFRARRMIRGMGHMLFPRYIQREARDFFYLTSRPILPGAPLRSPASVPEPGEGVWRTSGLPQQGFPYSLATTWLHGDPRRPEIKLRVVRADPRTIRPSSPLSDEEATVLAIVGSTPGPVSLWWSRGLFDVGPSAPSKEAIAIAGGCRAADPPAATAHAAAGVEDEDGMLVWVELPPDIQPDMSTAAAMDSLLERIGCSQRMVLPGDARALLGGGSNVPNAAADPLTARDARPSKLNGSTAIRLVRAQAPDAHRIFEDTPIVPLAVWQPLQAKRVRYFYKPPAASAAAAASAPPQGVASSAAPLKILATPPTPR